MYSKIWFDLKHTSYPSPGSMCVRNQKTTELDGFDASCLWWDHVVSSRQTILKSFYRHLQRLAPFTSESRADVLDSYAAMTQRHNGSFMWPWHLLLLSIFTDPISRLPLLKTTNTASSKDPREQEESKVHGNATKPFVYWCLKESDWILYETENAVYFEFQLFPAIVTLECTGVESL